MPACAAVELKVLSPPALAPRHVLPRQPGRPLPDGTGASPAHCPAGSALYRALVHVAATDALDILQLSRRTFAVVVTHRG